MRVLSQLHMHLDLSSQVLSLELQDREDWGSVFFETPPGLVGAEGDIPENQAPPAVAPLIPTLADMAPGGTFASASLFALKAKLFNDELYASVERFCQIDNPTCAGKALMLADLLTELQDRRATDTVDETTANEAIAGILAAVQLGGLKAIRYLA